MIIRNMRKVLSSIVLATYLMIYAAPMGFCLAATPVIDAGVGVAKPVLRTAKPAPVVKAASSALKLEGDISISKGNPKITLSLRDSDVKQVLRMFADKAGLNVVFHSSVVVADSAESKDSTGKITLDMVNMPLNDAFKLVMQVSELTYYVDHNTIVVTSAEAAKKLNLAKQEMISIPIKYVDASVMANFLNKNIFSINKPGLSNTQTVITNPGSNEILIVGTENDYLMAKKIVQKLDVKPTRSTYTVNHTTPREMANLLCTVLFPPASGVSGPAGSASSGGTGLTLGQGIVACTYKPSADTGTLTSLAGNSLSVAYFPQHGTVAVSGGSPQQQELVKEFIAKNDKKQPQAYLEFSIIELSESGSQTFENTWQIWSEMFSANFDGSTHTNELYPTFFKGNGYRLVDPKTIDPVTYEPKVLQQFTKYPGTGLITYTMNYLIENKKGRVLANPRIMITNGENSTIDLTSDYVKKVTSQVLAGSLTGATQKTYEIANDDGIKIALTPFISPDGYVTLNIKPEYATIKEKVWDKGVVGTDLVATLLQRRNLDLKNVRIKDGETLIIGGMIREDEQKTVSKIPVLGDLPGVGMFFRNTATTKTKQELVIMITPKIIKDSEEMVNNSDMTL